MRIGTSSLFYHSGIDLSFTFLFLKYLLLVYLFGCAGSLLWHLESSIFSCGMQNLLVEASGIFTWDIQVLSFDM